jgi:hypothetical protein
MNFKIHVKADIFKIKSLLVNSTDKMDSFFTKEFGLKHNRIFVAKADGMKLKLSVFHRYKTLQFLKLKGEIHVNNNSINTINFSYYTNPLYILYLLFIFIMATLMLFEIFESESFITFIIIFVIYMFCIGSAFFMIKNNMRELRAFIYRTYHDYIVENKDSI